MTAAQNVFTHSPIASRSSPSKVSDATLSRMAPGGRTISRPAQAIASGSSNTM